MNERRQDYPKIYESLEKLHDRILKLELQTGRLTSHIESERGNITRIMGELNDILNKHEEIIYGNGKDGFTTRVDRLENFKEDYHKHKDDFDRKITSVMLIVIGLVIKTVWEIIVKG